MNGSPAGRDMGLGADLGQNPAGACFQPEQAVQPEQQAFVAPRAAAAASVLPAGTPPDQHSPISQSMSSSYMVASPWFPTADWSPAPPSQRAAGLSVRADAGSSVQGDEVLVWQSRRNCSITPAQLLGVYLCLCLVSLVISGLFLFQGTPWVLAFAGLELLAVGLAFMVYARRAGDRERLSLTAAGLHVQQERGARIVDTVLPLAPLVVHAPGRGQALVLLRSGVQTALVGRHVRPEGRVSLAQSIQGQVSMARRRPTRAGLEGGQGPSTPIQSI